MRIPYDLMRDGLAAVNRAAERMADAQWQVATGRRINRPSDDPLGTQEAAAERAGIVAVDAYSRSQDSAAARLSAADAVFSSMGDKLSAVVVAALGAQGSSATAASRSAAADAVAGLRDALLSDLNTSFNGTFLFSGTQSAAPAYANLGGTWTYQGDANTAQVEVDRGRLVSVTFDGRAIAQGGDPVDVLTALDTLVAAINAGDDAAISTGIAAVERALDRTLRAQGRLGADERGLDEAAARLSLRRTAAEARRSKIEDANMAEAVARLSTAQTGYQAALAAVSSAERVSLLDYLR